MNILRLANASAYRGSTKVFDRVSLSIAAGQNTAIVGPNGSGKTTLLKIISREVYPLPTFDTVVELFGQDRWDVWKLRNRLGLVSADLQARYRPEVDGLSVVLSGYLSTVGIPDHLSVDDAQIVYARQVMKQLGIDHLHERSFEALSTGEQRKFLLARALVNQPEALIFDEPTAGLDLRASFDYLETMGQLIREGTTVILVTHHIHEIAPEIDNIILLKQGRVMLQGKKAEVLTSENLSRLFEIPVQVVSQNGFLQAFPGERKSGIGVPPV